MPKRAHFLAGAGMRSPARWLLMFVLLSAALPTVALAHAKPKHKPKPLSTATTISRLATQLNRLPGSSWARGQRSAVLGRLSASQTALHHKQTCSAISGFDAVAVRLLQPATWRRGVPRTVSRTLAPGLAKAEQVLVGRGSKCGARSFTLSMSRPSPVIGGSGFAPNPTVTTTNSQGDADFGEGPPPIGPYRPIPAGGATTAPGPDPQFAAPASSGPAPDLPGPRAAPFGRPHAAPDAFAPNVFESSSLGTPPRNVGEPKEPTVAMGHNVGWYTGNNSAGYSLDGGRSWTLLDPSTILMDPSGVSLCCDQQVVYSRAENVFVWLLQYWCPADSTGSNDCSKVDGSNVVRFAVASPDVLRADALAGNVGAAWHVVEDLTPQQLGQPANAWFDFSTLSVNDDFVNWTVDIWEGKNDAVAMRINAHSLATYRFQSEYFFGGRHIVAAQEPPGTSTSYFAVNNNTSQVRMLSWAAGSATPIVHDIDIPSIPTVNDSVNGTDGVNWNARTANLIGNVNSAAWSDNELLVAYMAARDQCTKSCGTAAQKTTHAFDHPAIVLDGVDTNATDWNKTRTTRNIYSDTLNYSWPSLGVALSGRVGISFMGSGDNQNPRAIAGILDDNYDTHGQWVSDPSAGPQPGAATGSGFSGGAGDYYSLQPGPSYTSFLLPYRSIDPQADGSSSDDWHMVYYGLGQPLTEAPPFVSLVAPAGGASYVVGQPVTLRAHVNDALDGVLPADAIVWSINGSRTGLRGELTQAVFPGPGTYTISVTATNSSGLQTTRSATITVTTPAPDSPSVQITAPADGAVFPATGNDGTNDYVDVPLTAIASDPSGRSLTYSWDDIVTQNGHTTNEFDISHFLSPTLRLEVDDNCGLARHKLTIYVNNGIAVAQATVTITVTSQNCVK